MQVTFFVVYGWVITLWIVSEYLNRTKVQQQEYDPLRTADLEMVGPVAGSETTLKPDANESTPADTVEKLGSAPDVSTRVSCARSNISMLHASLQSGLIR